jgi:hypothetical protein
MGSPASYRPFRLLANDDAAKKYFAEHVRGAFDVEMQRVA